MRIKRYHMIMPIWVLVVILASTFILSLNKKGMKVSYITSLGAYNYQSYVINIENPNLKFEDVIWDADPLKFLNLMEPKLAQKLSMQGSGAFYKFENRIVAPKARRHFEIENEQYIFDFHEPSEVLKGKAKLYLILKDLDKVVITLNGDTILKPKIVNKLDI